MTNHYKNKPPQEVDPACMRTGWRFRSTTLFLLLTLITANVFAQQQTVTGIVKSKSNNEALPGVSVLVKGTTVGTTTDADGKYIIQIPDAQNNVLVFSFIGFAAQEVSVGSRAVIDLNMEDDITQLNEVVVTALGISQEKRGLGYSIQDVKGKDIANTQRTNFLVALQGRVAGLQMTPTSGLPGSSVSINLRGFSSLAGSNQPLMVVDGLVINNSTYNSHASVSDFDNRNNDFTNRVSDLNPNDIESVTVLKGPEAAALYGQDGASGAIVITTKKGSKGGGKIEYNNSFGFQKVYRFPETQTTYGLGAGGLDNPNSQNFFGPKVADGTKIYNNRDAFFETGFSQVHNLSLDGGSDKATYRLSTNYTDQKGTVPTSRYKKLSVRLNSSAQITPKMDVNTSFNYILSDNVKPIKGEYGFLNGVLAYPFYDDMTNYLNADGTRRKLTASAYETDNPLFSVYKDQNRDKSNRILGNMQVNYNLLNWLTLTGKFGADVYSTVGNYFLNPYSYNGSDPRLGGLFAKGSIDNFSENSRLLNGMLLATAKKEFGKFKTSLLVGGVFDNYRDEVNAYKGEQLFLPYFNSTNNSLATTMRTKNSIYEKRVNSLLGTFTANYGDLVYLTVAARNDWSSSLPKANRSFFYPSVAMSFVFSELAALQNLRFLSYGKLRASYAQVGKDAPPYFTKTTLDSRTTTGGGFANGFFLGNPTLKPEHTNGYEVGTEVKFFNGRIGMDLAVYKKDIFNQVVTNQRISYATGGVLAALNGGSYSNRGIEIQLSGTPIETSNFSWNVLVNYTKTNSKVLNLPALQPEYYNSDTWLYGNARGSVFPTNLGTYPTYNTLNLNYNQVGLGKTTSIGGVDYQRNQNGDILINPSTGLPLVTSVFVPIGDRNPDFMIGLTNSFRYKNISLSFLLDIRKGGDVFNGNEMWLVRNGLSKRTLNREQPLVINGVLKDGNENTETPTRNTIGITPYTQVATAATGVTSNTYYNSIPESEYVEHDINWLRLRDVTISYQLPSNMKALKSASIFVTGTDLFMITNYTGADPSINGTTAATTGIGAYGMDFGSISMPRAFTCGVRIGL
jgi:TonB-linked SusC/RagA family outer membrane protein